MMKSLRKFQLNWNIGRTKTSERSYKVGEFNCFLPTTHHLPKYQSKYSTYDSYYGEWLCLIETNQNRQLRLLDIGANVGDTALFVLSHINAHITAVEPSSFFFRYLKRNVFLNKLENYVDLYQLAMVLKSEEEQELRLYGNGSTATLDKGRNYSGIKEELVKTRKLSDFVSSCKIPFDIIKIDIDANDFAFANEILDDSLSKNTIIVYEFDPLSLSADDCEQAFKVLTKFTFLKYSCVVIDNHGRIMQFTREIEFTLRQLTNWLKIQRQTDSQHIFYFDLWMFPNSRSDVYFQIQELNGIVQK